MGFSLCFSFGSSLLCVSVLALMFKPMASQDQDPSIEISQKQLNTDGYFVSQFFKEMGLTLRRSSSPHNFSDPICSCQGVSCDSQNQHVTGFVASGLGLSGPIPDLTIGKLTKLQSLDLSNNKITALPSDLWSLGSLKTLNLSNNTISGTLPNNIGNFGQLEELDLSGNNFSGEVPETITSLTNLKLLKLNQNGFQWNIPSGIISCQSLISLDLSSNRLNGSLPDVFGAAFPKLKSLNLASNRISGRDPDFSGLKSVTSLNISGNLFQGSVMGLFEDNNMLEVMDISRNHFQGHISQVHLNSSTYNWSHLVYLDLSENELSVEDTIFHSFNEAHNLKHLNLAHNRFSEHEFPQIDGLLGLEYLNLSNTSLIGHIPTKISQLTNLKTLDLSQNHLTGHVPILNTKSLKVLDLSHNNLSGDIPGSLLEKLPSMERFNFSYNNFTFCASEFSKSALKRSFFGSSSSCPVAANPSQFKRRASKNKAVKLTLALTLTLSMICLLFGLLFLAFYHRRKAKTKTKTKINMWAVKHSSSHKSYKEDENVSGPFSFQTDSTTWVADVKVATSVPVVILEKPLLNITFADLLNATSNFDRGTLLAEGKFGPVYRGFLPGNIHVAVKVLVHGSTLTDQEAARELELLGRIKHPNLVPLTGYCLAGDKRIAIYEYMENGNLQNFLHDLPLGIWSTESWEEEKGNDNINIINNNNNGMIQNVGSDNDQGSLTSWRFRHKIALGTARALAFLHHGCSPPITHRDVKSSSVYLDYNLDPRLSDFGLSKVFGSGLDDMSHGSSSSSSNGYMPPEFCSELDTPTPKSDVYCFGVVLFELITGKKPIGDGYGSEREASLVSWVRGLVRRSQGSKAIDPKIVETGQEYQMEEAIKIGYLCTAEVPSKRPTMQQVVGLLKDIEPL